MVYAAARAQYDRAGAFGGKARDDPETWTMSAHTQTDHDALAGADEAIWRSDQPAGGSALLRSWPTATALLALLLAGGAAGAVLAGTSGPLSWVLLVTAPLAAAAGVALLARRRTIARAGEATLLAELVRQSPEGRLITDLDGGLIFANRASQALLGGLPETLGELEARLAQPGEGMRALQSLRSAALGGEEAEAEVSLRLDGGGVRWLALRSHPIGVPTVRIGWYAADITPQREFQDRVREEQARLADFLDNAPVGFFSVDEDGYLLLSNNTLARWLDYRPTELAVGVALTDIVHGAVDEMLPCEALLGEQPQSGRVVLKRRDGTEILAQVVQAVVRDPASERLATHSVVRNLSAERAQEQDRSRFLSIFEHAPVAVLVTDRDGVIAESNAAFRGLLPHDAAVDGRRVTDFVEPDDRQAVSDLLARVWDENSAEAPLEVQLSAGDVDRQVELFASGLLDGGEGASGLLLHMIDTTQQRNLEMQFAQSQKMQAVGQLAGGVAHDFNNLLTAIIGHCDLLLLKARPGDEAFPDIMQVKQNANRAANLVRQLLAFSRQQTLRPKVLSLTDVLAELNHLVRRLIGENIELKMSHGRDLGLVKVDQGQFEQVIINLAVNARDAMADGGTVTIETRNVSREESMQTEHEVMHPGDYVLVEVSDTGKGIPREDFGRIFEPFYTTKLPGTNTGSGTGLGLSTVFGIVKQTGGYIFVDSHLGVGTTFTIYLPRYRQEAEAVASQEEADKPRDLTGHGTILLAEDEDAVRTFAARALKNKGYTVLEADSGETALEVLEQHQGKIDLLVSDVVMPNMDGPTLLREVRKELPDLRVIFISGYAEDAFRKNLDPDSAFELLPKPFSLKQLAAKVKEVLG